MSPPYRAFRIWHPEARLTSFHGYLKIPTSIAGSDRKGEATVHHLTGATAGRLAALLVARGVSPRRLHRLVPAIALSGWASLWKRLDSLRFDRRIAAMPRPPDPIIVVGHWRTGSTFLHQLLNCDPAATAPTVLQCALPEGFLTAAPWVAPVMRRVLGPTRPMDAVRLAPEEPQEDEFALLRSTGLSPLVRLFFQRDRAYFLRDAAPPWLEGGDPEAWAAALESFVKKVSFAADGRRVVLKNPFHSVRIPLLVSRYPGARFIHIRRSPMDVVPSTRRMWAIMAQHNHLRGGGGSAPQTAEVVEVYRQVLAKLDRDLAALPAERRCEVSYDRLRADPTGELRRVYAWFEIPYTEGFAAGLDAFLATVRNYRTREHRRDAGESALIRARLGEELAWCESQAVAR